MLRRTFSLATQQALRKRIALVINGTDFGGTESAVFHLACRLQQRGHDVQVLSIKPPGRMGVKLKEAGIQLTSFHMADAVSFPALAAGC